MNACNARSWMYYIIALLKLAMECIGQQSRSNLDAVTWCLFDSNNNYYLNRCCTWERLKRRYRDGANIYIYIIIVCVQHTYSRMYISILCPYMQRYRNSPWARVFIITCKRTYHINYEIITNLYDIIMY